jgi:spermidine synthase
MCVKEANVFGPPPWWRRDRGSAVSRAFEEIERKATSMGEISLRRRLEPSLQVVVFEVKLGDEFLMSSLFTAGEEALARLGLAATPGGELDVVVGGLGLGYTARAALEDPRVRSVHVVEGLAEVIDWHRRHLVPLGAELTGDARCHLVHGDFFAMVAAGMPFAVDGPTCFDVILVDIDHTPSHPLHPSHAGFYQPGGLRRLTEHLHPGGVFALWSDDPPDDAFVAVLRSEFDAADAHVVTFPNFYTGGEAAITVYVATTAGTK